MAAIGFASLPIVPSLRGVTKELSAQLVKPASEASKQAGEAMEKNIGQAAEKAASEVERARKKEVFVAQDVAKAEQAVEDARSKSEQAARKTKAAELDRERAVSQASTRLQKAEADYEKILGDSTATAEQVETAAQKVNQARLAGESDVLRKENNLQKAQDESRRSTEQVEAASENLAAQRLRSEDAADNLTAAEERLEKSQGESAEGLKGWKLSAEDAEQASRDLESAQKGLELGIAAAGGAVVAAMGGLMSIGKDFHGMSRQIAVSSGATGDDLRALEESAMDVATTVPVSFEESADAIAGLNTLTGATGPVLEELSTQVLNAANLLGEDGVGAAEAYGSAMKQWGVDAEEGASMMDGLFTVTQDYGIGLTELTGGLSAYGATLKNAGFEMDEAAVLFGNLDAAGLSVSRIMPGLNKAFRDWAGEGKDVQEELAGVVDQIKETESSQEALALATDVFGAQGAQRLTTAIREGQFSLEDFETALGDTEGAIAQTAEENRTLEESFQLMKNEALVAIEPLATELFDSLIPAVEGLGEKLSEMVEWVSENQELVKGLAAVVGGMAAGLLAARGAVIAYTVAKRAMNVATLLATGGFKALNTTMRTNLFVVIATAVAGLVAGLVYFFTQTEKGQEIWESFTEIMGTAWDWVVDKLTAGWEWMRDNVFTPLWEFVSETVWPILQTVFEFIGDAWESLSTGIQWAWENLIKPTFDFLWQVAQVTLGVIGTVILAPLLIAWEAMSAGIQWAWENYILPSWERLQAVISFLWESVLQPIFGFIVDSWERLSTAISWAWENIIQPAWQAVQDAATWMYENVLQPVFSWIGDRWGDLSNAIRWAYDNIIQPAWDALGDALNWLYENVVQPVLQWFQDRWDDMAAGLHAGWRWIDDNVFSALSDGLDWLQGVFDSAVDGIRTIWDGLRSALGKPVKMVITRIWNDGLLAAWNQIAEFLPGIDTVDPYEPAWLGEFAHGTSNIVPGPRSVGRDNMDFVSTNGRYGISLAGNEGIAHQHLVDGLGGKSAWDRLNYVSRTRGPDAVKDELLPVEKHGRESAFSHRHLGSFNAGGVIPAMINIVTQKYPGLTMTSGYRAGASGYHGRGLATDWSNGSTSTPMQLALAQDIATTYPGSAQLIYDHPGWTGNIANGQNVGAFGGYYNLAEAGRHDHHVHWAMTEAPTMPFGGGVFEGGSDGGGGGGIFNWIAERARGIWESVVSPIRGFIENALPDWGDSKFADIPMGFFNAVKDAAWDRISSLFGSAGGSVDVSDISGPIVDQVEEVFARHGFTGQQWEDAKWIIQRESNWNPTAVNPSSGAFGLFQFNPMGGDTLGQYLPDRNPDPAVQADAGARYMRNRYGDPTSARRFWEQNQWYDEGGWLQPGVTQVMNETGKPEAVFTDWQWMIMRGIVDGTTDMANAIATVLGDDSDLVMSIRDFSNIVDEQSQIDWDTRLQSLEDHLAGIEINDEGEREQVRGRVGTPEEIALWAGTEVAEQLANDALGLIGLGGLVDLPRHLDDDLRVPYEQQPAPSDTPADAAAAGVDDQVQSVAEQSTEVGAAGGHSAGTVTVNVTFNNVDPNNVDELRGMVDELADKVSRAANGRRDAVSVSRGAPL